jgi:hypothetical protein
VPTDVAPTIDYRDQTYNFLLSLALGLLESFGFLLGLLSKSFVMLLLFSHAAELLFLQDLHARLLQKLLTEDVHEGLGGLLELEQLVALDARSSVHKDLLRGRLRRRLLFETPFTGLAITKSVCAVKSYIGGLSLTSSFGGSVCISMCFLSCPASGVLVSRFPPSAPLTDVSKAGDLRLGRRSREAAGEERVVASSSRLLLRAQPWRRRCFRG